MQLRDVIPNGIYGRRVLERMQALIVIGKTPAGWVKVRPWLHRSKDWGDVAEVTPDVLIELPAGNPQLREANQARHLLRSHERVTA
jgi:hypothetical protein